MKNILITGISSGIGKAAAIFLAQKGYHVFGTVRKKSDLESIAALKIENISPVIMDVTRTDDIYALKQEMKDIPLAGLINNSGIAVSGPLKYLTIEKIREQFDVNVFGLLNVTQAFIPNLELQKKKYGSAGRIINISSVSGLMVRPFTSPYAASKYAVEALSDGLRRELAHSGIKVSLIEPGPIKTDIWGKALDEDTSAFINEYSKVLDFRKDFIQQTIDNALHVDEVSKAIFKALTAKNPPIRKIVTKNPGLFKLTLKLPDRLIDYITKKKMKIN